MIVTVTLNPAIDIAYNVEHFQIDKGHRVEAGKKTPGGKGLNVSRVLSDLGKEPVCTGFLGGDNGQWIIKQLDAMGMSQAFIEIEGETRTCLAFIDRASGTQTELLEKGPIISEYEQEEFEEVLKQLMNEASIMTISGSLAAGIPTTYYQDICEWANSAHIPVLLDTSGEALEKGIAGKPFLIKPNKEELCKYLKQDDATDAEMIAAAQEICEQGVQYVLLSLGGDGALLISQDQILQAEIPPIEAISAVGSGDSMVAGMAYALEEKFSIADCLKWACACGTANALETATGRVDRQNVEELFATIQVKKM